MPLIHIPVGVHPCQIDDFPEKVKSDRGEERPFDRSHKGALYLRPASSKVVSDDELHWLRTAPQHKALGRRLAVVDVKVVPDKSDKPHAEPKAAPAAKPAAPAPAAAKPAPAPAPAPAAVKEEDAAKEDKGKDKKRGR